MMNMVNWAAWKIYLAVPTPGDGGGGSGKIDSIDPTEPPGGQKLLNVASWVMWIAVLALMVAAIIAGVRLAVQKSRGVGGGEGEAQLTYVIVGAIVIATAVSLVNMLVLGSR